MDKNPCKETYPIIPLSPIVKEEIDKINKSLNAVPLFYPSTQDFRIEKIKTAYGLLEDEAYIFIALNDRIRFTFEEFIPLIKALPKSYSEKEVPLNRLIDSVQWFYFISKTLDNRAFIDYVDYREMRRRIASNQINLMLKIRRIDPKYIFDETLLWYYGLNSDIMAVRPLA